MKKITLVDRVEKKRCVRLKKRCEINIYGGLGRFGSIGFHL